MGANAAPVTFPTPAKKPNFPDVDKTFVSFTSPFLNFITIFLSVAIDQYDQNKIKL
eukprot:m.77761 g.77761  ORF g.77761 m.77761 type:complete len:56 (-) comp8554_c0_seq2:168-335(-)